MSAPGSPPSQCGQRILLVRLSAVGDVVHSLPVLNALREARPDTHIAWAVHAGPANLLHGHPQLDEVIIVPRRPSGLRGLREIRHLLTAGRPRWDVAIDLQGLAKSGLVARLSGAPVRVGFRGPASRELNWLFMTRRVQPKSSAVIGMNLELLSALGIQAGPAVARFHVDPADEQVIADWARSANCKGVRFLILDPFAGWPTKLWPHDRWIAVAKAAAAQHGLRPLVFFGPGEKPHAQLLAAEIRATGADALVAPETTLRQYVALLRAHAAAMVAADTGPMHMAAAVGVPTVAIFGPSDPVRNAPAFAHARFRTLHDPAQPCANTFARYCRHHAPGHCMDSITPEQVAAALGEVLSAAP